jgi:hypothetical protein
MAKLLTVDAIEEEQGHKAKWDLKQWEDVAGLMRLRRENLLEVRQAVVGIEDETAKMRRALANSHTGQNPAAATAREPGLQAMGGVVMGAPEAMEGTGSAATASMPADLVQDGGVMEGVEWGGLLASRYIAVLRNARSGIIIEIPWRLAYKGVAGNEKADE